MCIPPNKILPTKQSINRNCLCKAMPRPQMNVVAGSAEAARVFSSSSSFLIAASSSLHSSTPFLSTSDSIRVLKERLSDKAMRECS